MSLARYVRKRDFSKTKEPKGRVRRAGGKHLVFVVHKHYTSHLHYDLRLEMEGVLKSWAVPKGPSMHPKDKRLAVHVEDHPYAYRTFEGTIPEGEYGAGKVEIWDQGTYRLIDGSVRKGKIIVELHGKRLKGGFVLVQMKGGKNWLLIKEKN